jgi:hypothetical protein
LYNEVDNFPLYYLDKLYSLETKEKSIAYQELFLDSDSTAKFILLKFKLLAQVEHFIDMSADDQKRLNELIGAINQIIEKHHQGKVAQEGIMDTLRMIIEQSSLAQVQRDPRCGQRNFLLQIDDEDDEDDEDLLRLNRLYCLEYGVTQYSIFRREMQLVSASKLISSIDRKYLRLLLEYLDATISEKHEVVDFSPLTLRPIL